MIFFKKNTQNAIEYPKSIEVNNQEYKVEVFFFKKKSSSVKMNDSKIIFRMSSYLSNREFESHFEYLLNRIRKRLEKQSNIGQNSNFMNIEEVIEKRYFYFDNELYEIKFEENRRRSTLNKDNIIQLPQNLDCEIIEKIIIKLLIKKYSPKLKEIVNAVNFQTYKYELGEIDLKSLKSKWGHCKGKNNIMLNLKLFNTEFDIFRYVIIHELAHIVHKNHSSNFWNLVLRYYPNYKQARKILNNSPPSIFAKKKLY